MQQIHIYFKILIVVEPQIYFFWKEVLKMEENKLTVMGDILNGGNSQKVRTLAPLEQLPEGDYNFTVSNVEIEEFEGSKKMPPCERIFMRLTFKNEFGEELILYDRFALLKQYAWKLNGFLASLEGVDINDISQMNLNDFMEELDGKKGKAHLTTTKYTNAEGETIDGNKILFYVAE